MALNDESTTVRALALRLVGRLAERNPAYVNPALRRHLLQVWDKCVTDVEWVCQGSALYLTQMSPVSPFAEWSSIEAY